MWQAKTFTVCVLMCLFCALGISGQKTETGANPKYTFGKPDATYKIEVFVDFQCGACAAFNEKLDVLKAKYPDDIFIILRHFPLTTIHKNALWAAKAVESAGKQGKFWEMSDLILRNQKKWDSNASPETIFVKYARKLELQVEVFETDLQSSEIEERINLDVKRARNLSITATPTVLLNDKILSFEEALNLEEIITKDK